MDLDIYGKVHNFAGRSLRECPFRYQGQYEDSETGLYYNRFRYYDSDTGSYISQDPIRLAGNNPTLYGYVKDPNIWIDVFGLDCGMNNPKTKNAAALGNEVHYDKLNGSVGEHLPSELQNKYPNTEFSFPRRGQKGADVEVIGGQHPSTYPGSTWSPSNQYGDFKPDTSSGQRTFNRDVQSGKLPANTQILPYDSQGHLK